MSKVTAVLVVEDDNFKRTTITDWLSSRFSLADIVVAESVHGAVRTTNAKLFDLVILDMALPSHSVGPGESPATSMLSGGMEVIMHLAYKHRADKIVVLTQYPEIEIEGDLIETRSAAPILRGLFGDCIVATILYEHNGQAWLSELEQAVASI